MNYMQMPALLHEPLYFSLIYINVIFPQSRYSGISAHPVIPEFLPHPVIPEFLPHLVIPEFRVSEISGI